MTGSFGLVKVLRSCFSADWLWRGKQLSHCPCPLGKALGDCSPVKTSVCREEYTAAILELKEDHRIDKYGGMYIVCVIGADLS